MLLSQRGKKAGLQAPDINLTLHTLSKIVRCGYKSLTELAPGIGGWDARNVLC